MLLCHCLLSALMTTSGNASSSKSYCSRLAWCCRREKSIQKCPPDSIIDSHQGNASQSSAIIHSPIVNPLQGNSKILSSERHSEIIPRFLAQPMPHRFFAPYSPHRITTSQSSANVSIHEAEGSGFLKSLSNPRRAGTRVIPKKSTWETRISPTTSFGDPLISIVMYIPTTDPVTHRKFRRVEVLDLIWRANGTNSRWQMVIKRNTSMHLTATFVVWTKRRKRTHCLTD